MQIEEEVTSGDAVVHRVLARGTLMISQLRLLPGLEPVSEAAWCTQLTPGSTPSA